MNNNVDEFESQLSDRLALPIERVHEALEEIRGVGYIIDIKHPDVRRNREVEGTQAPASSRSDVPQLWMPTAAAMRNAKATVRLVDITVHLARYRVVKAEKKQQPTSAEWLRWLFADEEKAIAAERKEQQATRQGRSWSDVAD